MSPFFWLLVYNSDGVILHVHRVSKNSQNCFRQNFVKFPPTLIIFGTKMAKPIELCKKHSFSTSPQCYPISANTTQYQYCCNPVCWIRNWSHIATHLISSCCSCCWGRLSSKWLCCFKSIWSGWNLSGMLFKQIRIYWQNPMADMTWCLHGGGCDIISRRKVLPSGVGTHSICKFLIHSSFVHIL